MWTAVAAAAVMLVVACPAAAADDNPPAWHQVSKGLDTVWVLLRAFLVFFAIKKTVGLRVGRSEELRGLDIGEHGMESYAGFQVFTTQ